MHLLKLEALHVCVFRQIFNQIIKQSKNTYLEHWDQETKTLSKLQFYRTLKSNYELEDYLQSVRDTKQRRILNKSQWAQSSHRDQQTQNELVTQVGGEWLFPGSGDLKMQITEKR